MANKYTDKAVSYDTIMGMSDTDAIETEYMTVNIIDSNNLSIASQYYSKKKSASDSATSNITDITTTLNNTKSNRFTQGTGATQLSNLDEINTNINTINKSSSDFDSVAIDGANGLGYAVEAYNKKLKTVQNNARKKYLRAEADKYNAQDNPNKMKVLETKTGSYWSNVKPTITGNYYVFDTQRIRQKKIFRKTTSFDEGEEVQAYPTSYRNYTVYYEEVTCKYINYESLIEGPFNGLDSNADEIEADLREVGWSLPWPEGYFSS